MGIHERKQRERAQRFNNILEAARRCFEKKGFLKTTLQDVAEEAEISVGLIYRYFESKEDIFASLALKGAEQMDDEITQILNHPPVSEPQCLKLAQLELVLYQIAESFLAYYGKYGEYFDMLLYSYKGMKSVQIRGITLTRLISVTLGTLEKLKVFIIQCPAFRASDENRALEVVFLLWSILLGCHKLFDGFGRGHLFVYPREPFLRSAVQLMMNGITRSVDIGEKKKLSGDKRKVKKRVVKRNKSGVASPSLRKGEACV